MPPYETELADDRHVIAEEISILHTLIDNLEGELSHFIKALSPVLRPEDACKAEEVRKQPNRPASPVAERITEAGIRIESLRMAVNDTRKRLEA